jgi:hypothetical protein
LIAGRGLETASRRGATFKKGSLFARWGTSTRAEASACTPGY